MVAVPLPPPVQRHQQQVGPGQLRQGRGGPGQLEHRLAQRPGHPLQHRGPGQEHPLPAGDPGQELRLHVLAHQPVIAAEGDRRARQRAALPQVKSRQVQPGRPALGPPVQLRHLIRAQRHLGVAQQRRRLVQGQRQIPGADLQDPALGAQPRDPQRRLGPARQRQPRAGRHMIGQHRQRGPALLSCAARARRPGRSTTGEVIDENAAPSRGTTEPGTELTGEASASNTRPSIGSTASSASAT